MAIDFADGDHHDGPMGKKPVPNVPLQTARKSRPGLTLEQLSAETGISQSQLSRFESGKREPKANDLRKLANYYGRSVDSLLPDAIMVPDTPVIATTLNAGAELASQIDAVVLKWLLSGAFEGCEIVPDEAEFLAESLITASRLRRFRDLADLAPEEARKHGASLVLPLRPRRPR